MTLHDNSILSNRITKKHGIKMKILTAYKLFPEDATDREIMRALGYDELAKVQPRITELIQTGDLVETLCKVKLSGRWVRTVRLSEKYIRP